MPELRKISGREAVRALEHLGFRRIRQRGSHVILIRETPEAKVGCVVPMHPELKIGTIKGILRQAKLSTDDFMQAL